MELFHLLNQIVSMIFPFFWTQGLLCFVKHSLKHVIAEVMMQLNCHRRDCQTNVIKILT